MAPRRFEVFRGAGIFAANIADALKEHQAPPFVEVYSEGDVHEGAVIVVTSAEDARRITDWVMGYVAGWEDCEETLEEDDDPEEPEDG